MHDCTKYVTVIFLHTESVHHIGILINMKTAAMQPEFAYLSKFVNSSHVLHQESISNKVIISLIVQCKTKYDCI